MTDVSPCPDCGAAPAWSRCECDFVGVRAKRKHEQRIAELEAEVERLRADGERLDELERLVASGFDVTADPDYKVVHYFIQSDDQAVYRGDGSLRAAIDAARKEKP